jgi:hypothetical protein
LRPTRLCRIWSLIFSQYPGLLSGTGPISNAQPPRDSEKKLKSLFFSFVGSCSFTLKFLQRKVGELARRGRKRGGAWTGSVAGLPRVSVRAARPSAVGPGSGDHFILFSLAGPARASGAGQARYLAMPAAMPLAALCGSRSGGGPANGTQRQGRWRRPTCACLSR